MFWLSLLLIGSTGLSETYLSFSSTTNPSNATISLPFGTASNQAYSVEFWMRPVFASSSTGTVTVVTNANGWNFFYDIQDTTGRFNYNSQDYCSIPNLAFNVWSHIVGTYSLSPNFSCYVNATFVSSYTGSIISGKSPAALLIGGNFYGNVVDLRAWQGITLSLYAISKNYTSIFVSPWPTSLSKYYKLSDGSTSIKESIAGSTQNLPTSMKTPWLTETTGSLVLCSPGYYNSAGNCNVCPSTCSFCKGTQTSACYNTARNFVNTTLLASSDIIKFVFPVSTSTIEFWLYPSSWGTNIQLLTIQNLLNVQQRAADSIISLYDGSGTEKYNFSAPIQNWVHVAWVWSSKTATIYVNGTSSPSFTWSNTTAGTVVYINNSTSSKFQGLVADLRPLEFCPQHHADPVKPLHKLHDDYDADRPAEGLPPERQVHHPEVLGRVQCHLLKSDHCLGHPGLHLPGLPLRVSLPELLQLQPGRVLRLRLLLSGLQRPHLHQLHGVSPQ